MTRRKEEAGQPNNTNSPITERNGSFDAAKAARLLRKYDKDMGRAGLLQFAPGSVPLQDVRVARQAAVRRP